jgi:hypothetical protein
VFEPTLPDLLDSEMPGMRFGAECPTGGRCVAEMENDSAERLDIDSDEGVCLLACEIGIISQLTEMFALSQNLQNTSS